MSIDIIPGLKAEDSRIRLYSYSVWHTKERWKTTGKISTYSDLDFAMKQEHPLMEKYQVV